MITFSDQRLGDIFEAFKGKRIAVVGDLMVDHYFWGNVSRISPEAPVPVVDIVAESVRLGGAANVANNIQSLGGQPFLVGLVGDDHQGKRFEELLRDQGMDPKGIVVDASRPTTMKTRVIAHDQHVVRIDHESKADCPDHLFHRIIDAVKYNIHSIDAIILEDYNKGVVSKSVIEEITAVARKYDKVITVDPKFNNFFDFRHVTVFKPNRKEVEEVLGGKIRKREEVDHAGLKLLDVLQAKSVLLTLGEDGMSLYQDNGEIHHLKSEATRVLDVSGAGDTVIATLTMALIGGATLAEAATLANFGAGVVVGSVGIVPIQREELMQAVKSKVHTAGTAT